MTEITGNEKYFCESCNAGVKGFHRYCHHCGEYLGSDGTKINLFNNSNLQSAFGFFILYLFVCLVVQSTDWFSSYDMLIWVEIFLAALTFYHAVKNFATIKPILKFRNFSWIRVTGCISLAVVCSFFVNIIITKLNFSFFGTDTSYYDRYSIYSMPWLVMVYSIAVYPAIVEELAFRGVLYNYLDTFLDQRVVVIVTGFTFGMMHLSFISLFWLVPFGILVGAMRKRFGTIWYGVIFHFTFNLVAVIFDLYRHGHLLN